MGDVVRAAKDHADALAARGVGELGPAQGVSSPARRLSEKPRRHSVCGEGEQRVNSGHGSCKSAWFWLEGRGRIEGGIEGGHIAGDCGGVGRWCGGGVVMLV